LSWCRTSYVALDDLMTRGDELVKPAIMDGQGGKLSLARKGYCKRPNMQSRNGGVLIEIVSNAYLTYLPGPGSEGR
jgi:hypothetical protein